MLKINLVFFPQPSGEVLTTDESSVCDAIGRSSKASFLSEIKAGDSLKPCSRGNNYLIISMALHNIRLEGEFLPARAG